MPDSRTNNWFMIGSPWPGLAIIGIYLHFIYRLGPSIMAKRKPMNLDRVMQIYDLVQIILNSYLFYKALVLAWLKDYNYTCEPIDYSNSPKAIEVASTVYLYFILKILDLLDTVFFVLRKKDNQISFLHVYHHAGMVMGGWGGVKYVPGGHITFLGLVNAFVHMVMYSHYLIMSLRITKPWWKKYITQLQLFQFFLILVHFSQLFFRDCGFPLWPVLVFIPQNLFMIVLFGDFYYKTYVKKPNKKLTVNGRAYVETSNGKTKTQ
ncbi:elongation of very long chain fatty acids protein AAEL008004-like isoform X2 [Copidosoma floridanum]|uniref:elongation of very long chain fatty acids protein AAEL008004-like isoform X2 n=1 Tax=Copidosoma floridanum TaxID=29053 RepID=UPI0006C9C800|nr:elongation of very long chain fatty acids protein AAEL008004-like isoform X2 [Copidosoma floridanum]